MEENCSQLGADLGLKPLELRRFEKALALHNEAQRGAPDDREDCCEQEGQVPDDWDEDPFGFGPCA